ncbi:S41 family peptidase [Deinococcus navajonensis]|uniref:S41 family peptidase n=1 Tax=Deinococcus navajonensis TaxID=309884 RepID=A0ABV8XRZ0_9DEIO
MRFSFRRLAPILLTLSLSGAAAGGAERHTTVDAFVVYSEAARLLNNHYAGPDMLGIGPLLDREGAALKRACAGTIPCPETLGRAAVEHVIHALHDGHTSVHWDVDLEQARAPVYVKRSGMLTLPTPEGDLQVVHVDDTSEAERASVHPGDVVLAVIGLPPAASAAALTRQIRAAEDSGQPFKVRLRRTGLEQTVTLKGRMGLWGPVPSLRWEGKVAVISLPILKAGTGIRFANLVTQAQALGATGLVVDVRLNPGGTIPDLLVAAEALNANTSTFSSVARSGRVTEDWTRVSEQGAPPERYVFTRWNKPLVILTSSQTASAGEILTYLARRAGAQVIGEATYGIMNTASSTHALPGGSTLNLTSTRTVGSSGQWIPARVVPDQLVPLTAGDRAAGRDAQLQAALRWVALQ